MAENNKIQTTHQPAPSPQHSPSAQTPPGTANINNPPPEKGKAVTVGFSGTLKRIDS